MEDMETKKEALQDNKPIAWHNREKTHHHDRAEEHLPDQFKQKRQTDLKSS